MSELALYQLEGMYVLDAGSRAVPRIKARRRRATGPKLYSPEQLLAFEDGAEADKAPDSTEVKEASKAPDGDGGDGLYNPDNEPKKKPKKPFWKRRGVIVGGGGGAVLLGILILLIALAGSLKVIHFSQILTSAGYARLNGILEERTTQDLFDASAVEGSGSAQLGGRTLADRLLFRNVDKELANLGREGRFSLLSGEGKDFTGFKIRDNTIDVNNISKELFGGEKNFSDLNITQRLTVRKEVVTRGQVAINEELGTAPKYVRSRVTSTIADNVGFSWSRWRQVLREKFGASANPTNSETDQADRVQIAEDVLAETESKDLGPTLDEVVSKMRKPERLQELMAKYGAENIDPKILADGFEADLNKAGSIGSTASQLSTGVIIFSLACMAHEVFSNIPQIANSNEKQVSQVGLTLGAAGSQAKKGVTTAPLMGSAARQLNGAENAPDYQRLFGHTGDASVEAPRLTPEFDSSLTDLVSKLTSPSQWASFGLTNLPVLDKVGDYADDKFCNFILSPQGAISVAIADVGVQAVIGFFTAGGGTAAEQFGTREAINIFVQELGRATMNTARNLVSKESLGAIGAFTAYGIGLEYVALMLSGESITGANGGAGYYETAWAGTNVVQNRQARAVGGKPLSTQEAATVDVPYQQLAKATWQQKSASQRYFAISNPYSLLGTMSAYIPSSYSEIPGRVGSMFSGIGSLLSGSFLSNNPLTSMFSQKAYAQDTTINATNDITQWGFSPDELATLRTDPSYTITENEKNISQQRIQQLDQTYGKCFDASHTQYEVSSMSECSESKLSGPEMLRYRVYKMDSYVVNSATGQEGTPS